MTLNETTLILTPNGLWRSRLEKGSAAAFFELYESVMRSDSTDFVFTMSKAQQDDRVVILGNVTATLSVEVPEWFYSNGTA